MEALPDQCRPARSIANRREADLRLGDRRGRLTAIGPKRAMAVRLVRAWIRVPLNRVRGDVGACKRAVAVALFAVDQLSVLRTAPMLHQEHVARARAL